MHACHAAGSYISKFKYVQANARCGKYRLALFGYCWQQHITVQYLCVVINASTQSLEAFF